jgi:large subunit ribosomal protein L32e
MVTKEIKQKLGLRKKVKKAKPTFKRQELGRQPMLKDTWRRPRGRHSKLRVGEKARGKKPSIGYSSPSEVRGLNRNGLKEVIVSNVNQIEKINPKEEMGIISGTVGKKKRFEMLEFAKEKNIKLSNA